MGASDAIAAIATSRSVGDRGAICDLSHLDGGSEWRDLERPIRSEADAAAECECASATEVGPAATAGGDSDDVDDRYDLSALDHMVDD